MRSDLDGWVIDMQLERQCKYCANVLRESSRNGAHTLAACEYGQPWFPNANRCPTFEQESSE